jgi:hypothetical protein
MTCYPTDTVELMRSIIDHIRDVTSAPVPCELQDVAWKRIGASIDKLAVLIDDPLRKEIIGGGK